jgi:T5SS/PEP-CTERM-associated repeat protein/autotransporter-associated beta strand protein
MDMAAVNRRAAVQCLALSTELLVTTSLIALGLALGDATPARAQTIWTGANPGNWFSAPNWSSGLPNASIDSRIDAGTAEVGAPGAAARNLFVGFNNTGALTLRNGGKLNSASGTLGLNASSSGSATVGGVGSSWSTSGTFTAGLNGAGTLLIQGGGAVSNSDGTIGQNVGSIGKVTVDGAGSTWTVSNFLTIGNRGNGTLSIQNGGKANTNSDIPVGSAVGSTGTVTVNGVGSTWTNSGGLDIGYFGTGTLLIQSGAAVSMGTISSVGRRLGSTGSVTVDGAGSTWTNSSSTYVGDSGTGTLRIQNGGKVIDYNGYVGRLAGSTGSATVDGNSSIWANSNDLIIGNGGTGTLTVQNGGKVSNVSGSLGSGTSSTGTATVDGVGSIWTNSGNFYVGNFGSGTLTIRNGGMVSLAGPARIADQAGATGTLNIGAASGQAAAAPGTLTGSSVQFGAGTGKLVFNHTAADYVFAPLISGAGSVRVESGTTILTGVNTYTGTTSVTGGTLRVNGSLVSAVTIGPGGTLGGSGTLPNTTIAGGTLSPGNSIGTITVAGNLVLTAASTYLVEVSPTAADRTNVTGTATLGGATVSAMYQPGSYVDRRYTILNATGGRIGTFGSLVNTNLPRGFAASLSYDANNAYLDLVMAVPNFGPGLTINQTNVANALATSFNTAGGIPLVYGTLTPNGLTQASGEVATQSSTAAFQQSDYFLNLMLDPFVTSRGGAMGPDGTPLVNQYASEEADAYAATRKRSRSEQDAYAAMARKAPARNNLLDPRWSVWGAAYGGELKSDGNAAVVGSHNATTRAYGFAVGADYRLSPDTLLGFAISGGESRFSLGQNLGSGRADVFQAGVFARHNIGAGYIKGALAYGWHDVDTDRLVTAAGIDKLTAKYDAHSLSGRIEGGYRFVTPWMGVTPYVAGQAAVFWLPGYSEQVAVGANTFALNYASKDISTSRTELGVRTDKAFALGDALLTLRGRAAWAHYYETDRALVASFQALPASGFTVFGAAQARNVALVSASAETRWRNGFSIAGVFEGEFSDRTTGYAGKGVLRYQW